MPSEAALEAMAKRMDSTNFGFVVMAVNIQRTVGGSLAEILDMVADTVRQRQQFSRKVKALTAQGPDVGLRARSACRSSWPSPSSP